MAHRVHGSSTITSSCEEDNICRALPAKKEVVRRDRSQRRSNKASSIDYGSLTSEEQSRNELRRKYLGKRKPLGMTASFQHQESLTANQANPFDGRFREPSLLQTKDSTLDKEDLDCSG